MNVIKALRDYIIKVVRITQGMKVLVLDAETSGIVSMVYSQSEVLQEEVYLFERLDTPNRETMAHLKALCFLRPTLENINLLKKELRKPKYGEYYIFFTNVIDQKFLEQLATADEHEVVHEVQEIFGDYYAINSDCWSLNLPHTSSISPKSKGWPETLARTTQGLLACLLSLKIRPAVRVQKSSDLAQSLGNELLKQIKDNHELFNFRSSDVSPLLLIIDRKDDPVTPLLTQWTYQAMVHGMLGIENNLVDLSKIPSAADKKLDQTQIVLSAEQDSFYKENMFNNFGDLGTSVRALVEQYQSKSKQSAVAVNSIEDMKAFVKNFPDIKKLSGNVTKHMTLIEELQRQVKTKNLLDISEVEQELACVEDHEKACKSLNAMFSNSKIASAELVKLVLLYVLRYEMRKENKINTFIVMLQEKGAAADDIKLVKSIRSYAGIQKRSKGIDLFDNQSFMARTVNQTKRSLVGVENVYTQHVPYISKVVDEIKSNSLSELAYPFLDGSARSRPQQILIFIVGGVTYEEAACVASMNRNSVNVLLGGTHMLNTTSYLSALKESDLDSSEIKIDMI